MSVFRHGDIILPEIPSDWAEQLEEPLLESDSDDSMPQQLEFGFFKKLSSKVPVDVAWRSWEEGRRKIFEIMFGPDPSEDLE